MGKRRVRISAKSAGRAPGEAVFVGEIKTKDAVITQTDISQGTITRTELTKFDDTIVKVPDGVVRWINVNGLSDAALIEKLCACFALHPLIMEDILNTTQRPKMDEYKGCIYIDINSHTANSNTLNCEQVSIVLLKNCVLSFNEGKHDCFDALRNRIQNGVRMRRGGASTLAYALVDAVVDNEFVVLEKLSERVELLEDKLLTDPKPELLHSLQELRWQLLFMHKSAWPLREVVGALMRTESDLVGDSLDVFLRDLYDHAVQVLDTSETLRDLLGGLQELYLSSVSNRMNEVMKVLAIISTLFMPLSFIAGLYGMNFVHMPELKLAWAYPVVLCLMLLVVVMMFLYFKRKKWL